MNLEITFRYMDLHTGLDKFSLLGWIPQNNSVSNELTLFRYARQHSPGKKRDLWTADGISRMTFYAIFIMFNLNNLILWIKTIILPLKFHQRTQHKDCTHQDRLTMFDQQFGLPKIYILQKMFETLTS